MPQKTFTDDEILQLKSASAKTHSGEIVVIDLDDPINATIVVAPFTRAEYADHYDAKMRDAQTAYHGALLSQLLYPGFAEIEALRQDWPVIPGTVADELLEEAGATLEIPIVRRLDPAELPTGLDKVTATKLTEEHKNGRLWSVEMPGQGLSCVMLAPLADVWLAAHSANSDARAAGKGGIVAATESYVLGTVVWSREPLTSTGGTGILDRRPALYWELWAAYRRTGGYGTAVRRKRL